MRSLLRYTSLAAIAIVIGTVPSSALKTTGPKARYAMDVATTSGFAAMGGGAGMGSAMSMMFGGGPSGKVAHTLALRLGSSTPATMPPAKADHFFLPQAKMGKSVPLTAPEPVNTGSDGDFPRPKGRLLLFWGCGAHAPAGQPVIIDFSKIAAGQVPPGLWTSRVPRVRDVTVSNSVSYADWPRSKGGKQPSSGSSLLGEHRIAGNFSPEIKFTLAQDYMPPLDASTAMQADGSVRTTWNALEPATGYVAWAFGGMGGAGRGDTGDMVWWTSSNAREFGGGLWDWLPPATVKSLVTQKIVMPPSQTSCTIPAEVKAASGGFLFGNLNAFGPEADFSFPAKPADPKVTWNIDWTTKVRFRSQTSLLIGEGMEGMSGNGSSGSASDNPTKKKKCKGPFGVPIPGVAC